MAVAWALLLAPLVNVVLTHRILGRALGYSIRELLVSVRPSAFVSGATLCLPAATYYYFGMNEDSYLWLLFTVGPVSALVWVASLFVFGHPLAAEVRNIFGKLISTVAKKP